MYLLFVSVFFFSLYSSLLVRFFLLVFFSCLCFFLCVSSCAFLLACVSSCAFLLVRFLLACVFFLMAV